MLGHTGYIGSRLLLALQSADGRVPAFGRSLGELDLNRAGAADELEKLLDADSAVVICAGVKKQLGDNPETFSQNLAIALNIGSALAARPVRRVVFFSSAAVYGEDVEHDLIDEATCVTPTSYYGIGKFAAERILQRTVVNSGGSFLALRPALVYGPDEPAYYYGPSGFLQRARRDEPITLWGDGDELREFLYVDDVVEIAKRMTFGQATGVLNVVSGTSYTYRQALDAISVLLGKPADIRTRSRTKKRIDHCFSARGMKSACPAFAFTSLEAGLRLVAESTAERGTPA